MDDESSGLVGPEITPVDLRRKEFETNSNPLVADTRNSAGLQIGRRYLISINPECNYLTAIGSFSA